MSIYIKFVCDVCGEIESFLREDKYDNVTWLKRMLRERHGWSFGKQEKCLACKSKKQKERDTEC